MAQAPLLPLDLRIRTIEAQLFGLPSSLTDSTHVQRSESKPIKPATRRLREIEGALERLGGSSDGIKRLIDGYNRYLPLLTLPTLNTPLPAQDQNTVDDLKDPQPIRKEDLLPDKVKLAMVLEAANEIRGAERDLREIELLKARGVEGSGHLEQLIPFRGELIEAIRESDQRGNELDKARHDVARLLSRYSEFSDTASDLFIDLHHQLEALEEGVTRLERKKRKEIALRY
ncbi:hypothetical protein IAR55_004150 [Kwoniella newhampshirensis]|uniref:Dynactin 2 n=1 Tax=Kwoniella newhampshirensis TaxID=1651941 RepID=A0AAW0YY52_9TREE